MNASGFGFRGGSSSKRCFGFSPFHYARGLGVGSPRNSEGRFRNICNADILWSLFTGSSEPKKLSVFYQKYSNDDPQDKNCQNDYCWDFSFGHGVGVALDDADGVIETAGDEEGGADGLGTNCSSGAWGTRIDPVSPSSKYNLSASLP